MLRTLSFSQMPSGSRYHWPASVLAMAFAALVEGLAASRGYQQLRARGVGHDVAIRDAFGIGPARRHGVGSICFAGKA